MSTQKPHYASHDAGTEYGTPEWVVEPLEHALGGFDLDPFAGAEPRPYADVRYTVGDDGFTQRFLLPDRERTDVWINPPYGMVRWGDDGPDERTNINPIVADKILSEWQEGRPTTMTVLVPSGTSADWWQRYARAADVATFIGKRVSFVGGDTSASFGSTIFSFGEFPAAYYEALDELGTACRQLPYNGDQS